jgi:hypothetical protein
MIDARLFAPRAREGPRLTDLAVQTSAYGTQVPRVYGTMRVAGCVIWSTDLIETRDRHRGGKGQPATVSYDYAASFAVALSTRPIVSVRRIWADGTLLRGAAGDWKTRTGCRLHTGGEGQARDPLIASLEPDTPAYRGIAYAVFEQLPLGGFGNRIPSLTFEVVADAAPPTIGAVARDMAAGAVVGDGPADTLDGFAAAGGSVAGAIEVLADAAGAWLVPDGGAMRIANRLPGAALAIPDDAAVAERRAPIETVARLLSVAHYDPARDHQIGVQQARRAGGAGWREERVELAAALGASRARSIAADMLLRAERARVTRRVTLDAGALAIAPGAAVRSLGETWRVARVSVERSGVTLDLVPAPVTGATMAADAGRVLPAPDEIVGATVLAVAELPPLDEAATAVPRVAVFAAGRSAGWRGATLLVSRDGGAGWEAGGGTAMAAVMGALTAPLRAAPATLQDRRGTIEVALAHAGMTLESATAAAVDGGANVALVGDELLQFRDAVQVGTTRWRLSVLWRGRRATAATAHPAGARFVLVERDALRVLAMPAWQVGDMLSLLASGAGDVAGPVAAGVTLTGASIAPPPPVRVRAVRSAGGGVTVTWVRRSRLGWRWRDGGDVPLGEEREGYAVTLTAGGTTQRVTTAVPRAVFADVADGAATIEVRQLGTYAPSAPATLSIEGVTA